MLSVKTMFIIGYQVGLIIFIESMLQMPDCAFCCHYLDSNDDIIGIAQKQFKYFMYDVCSF